MIGIQHVEVKNRQAQFRFELRRNITVVTGDSGTGKTTLFEMIADSGRLGDKSGVQIRCEKRCVALTDTDWKNQLSNTKDSIVFVDEGAEYINGHEFASAVKASDNYYVLFYREGLHELPYSVDEIYEIKKSGKYHKLKQMYPSKNHIYAQRDKNKGYSVLLTEDAKSGFQFYKIFMEGRKADCVSAGSNGAIYSYLARNGNSSIFIVADGAAFGAQMNRVVKLIQRAPGNMILCLPESFEWLILKSGLVRSNQLEEILANPSAFIESGNYISWERFFTDCLVRFSNGTQYQYQKERLNPYYLIPANMEKIVSEINSINNSWDK